MLCLYVVIRCQSLARSHAGASLRPCTTIPRFDVMLYLCGIPTRSCISRPPSGDTRISGQTAVERCGVRVCDSRLKEKTRHVAGAEAQKHRAATAYRRGGQCFPPCSETLRGIGGRGRAVGPQRHSGCVLQPSGAPVDWMFMPLSPGNRARTAGSSRRFAPCVRVPR